MAIWDTRDALNRWLGLEKKIRIKTNRVSTTQRNLCACVTETTAGRTEKYDERRNTGVK